ncbi:siphovirus Gp157 family protein [Caballeronia sp. NCTM1]|uniref:siphovirus Gp157 family protein n=1 Tax=Caballeronia sp. NCTM1 TaxID=2921753 RepID=UPI0020284B29|nr:siphovirus Gp157 family protein [Caballeronia sp. NCTM1]
MNLFEIASEYRADVAKLEDLDLDEQTLLDTLEAIGGELETKAMNTAFVVRNLEATAAQIEEATKAMNDRAKALKNRAGRIRQYLLDGLTLAQCDKVDTPYFRIKIALNPPSVQISDESLIPANYKTDPVPPLPQPDKKLIAQALKDGFEVPGCSLVRGRRLDIK